MILPDQVLKASLSGMTIVAQGPGPYGDELIEPVIRSVTDNR